MATTMYECDRCGTRMGIAGENTGSQADYDAEEYFAAEVELHETGACSPAPVKGQKKRIRTRRQADALKAQRATGDAVRDWLDGLRAAARKLRRDTPPPAKPVGHGITQIMRGIPGPTPVPFATHVGLNHAARRRRALATGRAMAPSRNTPHQNPARDDKPGARLRKELRS